MNINYINKTSENISKSFAKNKIYITKISETTYDPDDFEFTFYREKLIVEQHLKPPAWKRQIDLERKIYKRLTRPLMIDFYKWYYKKAPNRFKTLEHLIYNLYMNGLGRYIYSLFRANHIIVHPNKKLTKFYKIVFENIYQNLWIKETWDYVPNKQLYFKYIHIRFLHELRDYAKFLFPIKRNFDGKIRYFIHLYRNNPQLIYKVLPFELLNKNYYSKQYFPLKVESKNKEIVKEKKRLQNIKNKLKETNDELFYNGSENDEVDLISLFEML